MFKIHHTVRLFTNSLTYPYVMYPIDKKIDQN